MEKIIKYRSILGKDFNTPEEAMEDEDRLPNIIKIYEGDLIKAKNPIYDADDVFNKYIIECIEDAISRYKNLWNRVQHQRQSMK